MLRILLGLNFWREKLVPVIVHSLESKDFKSKTDKYTNNERCCGPEMSALDRHSFLLKALNHSIKQIPPHRV